MELTRVEIEAKQRDAKADTSALERELDELVYALCALTPDEINSWKAKPNETPNRSKLRGILSANTESPREFLPAASSGVSFAPTDETKIRTNSLSDRGQPDAD
jgi:hypothetical protein